MSGESCTETSSRWRKHISASLCAAREWKFFTLLHREMNCTKEDILQFMMAAGKRLQPTLIINQNNLWLPFIDY